MAVHVGITSELLVKIEQLDQDPVDFFSELIESWGSTPVEFRVIGQCQLAVLHRLYQRLIDVDYLNSVTHAIACKITKQTQRCIFSDCSLEYGLSGWKQPNKKPPLDYVLAASAIPKQHQHVPYFKFSLNWDIDDNLIVALTHSNRKSYWFIDYDETLYSNKQGSVSINRWLLNHTAQLMSKKSACVLTARSDPLLMIQLIDELLKNPMAEVSAKISKFKWQDHEKLTWQAVEKLSARVSEFLKVNRSNSAVPCHRKQLIMNILELLQGNLVPSETEKSPWEIEELKGGSIFFMNTMVQRIINKFVPHLHREENLKGHFIKTRFFQRYAEKFKLQQFILVDDSPEQCRDWVVSDSRANTFLVSRSFLSEIGYVASQIKRLATNNSSQNNTFTGLS